MAARRSWSPAHVRRLFWRAGFGATPAEARRWAKAGRRATLAHVLTGGAPARLAGRPPAIRLDPENEWGHAQLWWLDRMVRTTRPLEERMTLAWHDHFATAEGDIPLLLRQNKMFRRHALGSFRGLLEAVTEDTAMQLFLSLADSDPEAPNENYARELMELFTLGHGYTERDIRQAARALTGFRSEWPDSGLPRTWYDPKAHDPRPTTILGRRGRHDWRDVLRIVTDHPNHAPFLVTKLWDSFIPEPIPAGTRRALARTYRRSGLRIAPVVGQILAHPALYADLHAPDMVKSPVTYVAGLLRTTGEHVRFDDWAWLLSEMGQMPFEPPSVAGWEGGTAWMSSNAMKTRHIAAGYLLSRGKVAVPEKSTPKGLKPAAAIKRAHRAAGEPWVGGGTAAAARRLAHGLLTGSDASHDSELQTRQDMVQRTLRQLFLAGADAQVC